MFTVDAGTTITTISELRTKAKQTLAASHDRPVVVLVDGQPAAVVISMEEYGRLQEFKENAQIARVAARRLERVRQGEDVLLDHDAFWDAVAERKASRTSGAL